jgi:signal transduction histidine kinase
MIAADPEGIHRAVLNLAANALEALEDWKNPAITVITGVERDGKWARVSIQDNGPGIPANKLADIFRPFVSTKGSKGTGLGLAVSRKILREHGGDILVQSRAGKGCKFILRLPVRSPLTNEPGATGNEMPTLRPPDE